MADWISDPNLSADEKLAHFESLGPSLTRGPIQMDMPFATPAARSDLTISGALYVAATPVSGNAGPRMLPFASDPGRSANTAGNVPANA